MSSALASRTSGMPEMPVSRRLIIASSPTRSMERWVSPGPGLTQFTRIPNPARSTAITCESATIPALATQYGGASLLGTERINRGGERDRTARAGFLHCQCDPPGEREVACQADVDLALPRLVGGVEERHLPRHQRVVRDQHVDPAGRGDGGVDDRGGRGPGSHRSTAIGIASAPSFVTSAVTALEAVGNELHQGHMRGALAGKPNCRRHSEPGAGAGHQCPPTRESLSSPRASLPSRPSGSLPNPDLTAPAYTRENRFSKMENRFSTRLVGASLHGCGMGV